MALIKCKECGKEISDSALICPNCGYKNKIINTKSYSKQIKTGSIVSLISCSIIILLILGFIIIGFTGDNNKEEQAGNINIEIGLTPSYIEFDDFIYFAISLLFTVICFIIIVLFLTKKIKNINLYKILLLLSSIIQLIFAFTSITSLVCCGIVYAIFPLINVIGSIIVVAGKKDEIN